MFRRVFLAILAAFLVSAAPAWAQRGYSRDGAYPGEVQPLDRILPQIRNRYPGTFYDAEGPFADPSGALHYRLKWMTPEGRVIWLDTDARTGRVLGEPHGWNRGVDPYARERGDYRGPPPPPPDVFRGPYPGPHFHDGPPGYGGFPDGGRGGHGEGHGNWGGHGGRGKHGW